MAYESNDKQELLSAIKLTEFTELRINKVIDENDNLKAYDIRNWYCTRTNPDMQPSKGIRIKKDNISDVISAVVSSLDDNLKKELMNKIG